MLIMPANNASGVVHHLATKYPGSIGHLWSPGRPIKAYEWIPYAIDNGVYTAYSNGTDWDCDAFYGHLGRCKYLPKPPLWVAAPDVVGSVEATIDLWHQHEPRLRSFGFPLAFVAQDGMTADMMPDCDVIFVGGTDGWKYRLLAEVSGRGKPVHVGRVNTSRNLWRCYRAGVASCDGSGWFRSNHGKPNTQALINFIRSIHSGESISERQLELIEQVELRASAILYQIDWEEEAPPSLHESLADWLAQDYGD